MQKKQKQIAPFHLIGEVWNAKWEPLTLDSWQSLLSFQLRIKGASLESYTEMAQQVLDTLKPLSLPLVINDDITVAKRSKANGIHLGQGDLHPMRARNVLGPSKLVGLTVNSLQDAQRAASLRHVVDYCGVGPIHTTQTKVNAREPLSEMEITDILQVLQKAQLPAIAIGGLQLADIEKLIKQGFYGVAASSAILNSEQPVKAIEAWLTEIQNSKKGAQGGSS